MYADDTVILAESERDLQKALNAMCEYCETYKLEVNRLKTKIVIFSRGKISNIPVFTFGESQIDVVDDYNYLGIVFNYNGNFNKNNKARYDQARKAMYAILCKARKLCLPVDVQLHLFDAVIKPILLYGCEVWGIESLNIIEKLHLEFCKNILGVNRRTCSIMVYGELGRFPMYIDVTTGYM